MKQKIIEAIENYCSYEDLDFRTDYSGRSMYGRKCIGIDEMRKHTRDFSRELVSVMQNS